MTREHAIEDQLGLVGATAEHRRLADSAARRADWKHRGPYVSECAWGTVREDYSPVGDAWASFPHDHARSRADRWNEDGLAWTTPAAPARPWPDAIVTLASSQVGSPPDDSVPARSSPISRRKRVMDGPRSGEGDGPAARPGHRSFGSC